MNFISTDVQDRQAIKKYPCAHLSIRSKYCMKTISPFAKKSTIHLLFVLCTFSLPAQVVTLTTATNIVLNGSIAVVIDNAGFKNNGKLTPGTGTVLFTGNADTTITKISGDSNTLFYNLIVNKSAGALKLKSTASVKNTLTVTAGKIFAEGKLTMLSDALGTASIAVGSAAGGYLAGDVTVERYIPQNNNRAWRLLTSPTIGQTIKQAWQEDQATGANINPGYGTIITSNSTAWSSNGFDFQSQKPSLYRYDSNLDTLLPVSATTTAIADEPGYFLYVRGNRSVLPSSAITTVNATILRTKGAVNTGNQPAINVAAGKFILVGNPYAAAIDLRNVTVAGGSAGTAFTVWDPKLMGSYKLGAYQTFYPSGGNYLIVPGGGSYGASGSVNNSIQSGAAFFVTATGSAGTVTINESSKITGSNLVFRPTENSAAITTNLFVIQGSGSNLADGNVVLFNDSHSNEIDEFDNRKMSNFGENLSIIKGTVELVVEKRRQLTTTDTLQFAMYNLKQMAYQLQITPSQMQQNTALLFLEDRYHNTNTLISITDTTLYNFTVDANVASAAENRFRIVLKPSVVLPLTITNLQAHLQATAIAIAWQVNNPVSAFKMEVEKSADGSTFSSAALLPANINTATATYRWLDETPAKGINYYRIKIISTSGSYSYSPIVYINFGDAITPFTISPNPVTGNIIGLQLSGQQTGNYAVKLVNDIGQVIFKTRLTNNYNNTTHPIPLPLNIAAGIYMLQISGPDNVLKSQQVIITKK